MISYNLYSKERGVVLITCLIFLILLLTLMRFTIGSAKMSELKVGADFDEMRAQAAADKTFQDVEFFLRRVNADGSSIDNPALNLANNESQITKSAINFWSNSANFSDKAGIFDGDTNGCQNIQCTNNNVNWNGECGVDFLCYRQLSDNDEMKTEQGKYIIERFMPGGDVLKIITSDTVQTESVIFRVTGISYSQPPVDKNGTKDYSNATYVMRQNTYILTYDPSIK